MLWKAYAEWLAGQLFLLGEYGVMILFILRKVCRYFRK